MANPSSYGLSSAVLTKDYEKGLWLVERLETGMVHINDSTVLDEPQVPFGEVKNSGLGRMGGQNAVDEFTDAKWIGDVSGSAPLYRVNLGLTMRRKIIRPQWRKYFQRYRVFEDLSTVLDVA